MSTVAKPIPARMKGLNRAEICDVNFQEFVREWRGDTDAAPAPGDAILAGSALDARGFRELFESQLVSRHLDLMARVLRVQNKVFYTIGSSGHEGNAMVARAARHTDPAFLHYRSGGFMAERFRKLPGMDPVMDGIADIALYAYTCVAPHGGIALDCYPAIRGWLARVEATPGFVPLPAPDAAAQALIDRSS